MSAALANLADADRNPSKHERMLYHKRYEAFDTLRAVARDSEFYPLVERLFEASCGLEGFWHGRAKLLARTLRDVLATDRVTTHERAMIVKAICGSQGRGRDPHLYTEIESDLLEAYRRLSPEWRAAVRKLIHISPLSYAEVQKMKDAQAVVVAAHDELKARR